MWTDARILVVEPEGMIGQGIIRALAERGLEPSLLDSASLDWRDGPQVDRFFASERPTHVFLAAGKKGGIQANQRYPADLMFDNLVVLPNVMRAALSVRTARLLYLGSSCLYPRDCPQPMREESLFTGRFEPTNEAYSTAKMAGLYLCQAIRKQHGLPFIAAIPTNIYGPGDDFDPDNSHVVAALIRKFHDAREAGRESVTLWGTGTARREFLHSDDLGRACVFLMENYDSAEPINIGCGSDLSIRDLAEWVRSIVGFRGAIRFDATKPDGMPRKLLDSYRLMRMGWRPEVRLEQGLRQTYDWYASPQSEANEGRVRCPILCS